MSKTKLSATGITALQNKIVTKYVRLEVNDVVNTDLISHSFSKDKDFASTSLTVELENGDGRYSIGGASEISLNSKVELIEGIITTASTETFHKFTGLVRQRAIGKKSGKNTLVLTCFDYLIRMQDLDYDAQIDSAKTSTAGVMYANELSDNPGFADTFNFRISGVDITNICPFPEPIIRVQPLSGDSTYEPLWEGYKIYYQEGQLKLNTTLHTGSWYLYAKFSYYAIADVNHVEDLIETIISANDDSGNAVFPGFATATHLRSTYTDEGETLPDTMTLNSATVNIAGTDYTAGRVSYLNFDNVTTALVNANFTYVGGGTPTFNARYGCMIFPTATTSCQCDINYTFKTIQTSGIQVPYIDITTRSVRNRFEAINRLKTCVAPNYCIYCDGEGKFWGRYLNQKTTADYTLYLEKSLDYAEAGDVYTRVKVYGQSGNPINLMQSVAVFDAGFTYIADTGGWTALTHNPTWDLNYDDGTPRDTGDLSVQAQWRAFDVSVDGAFDILEQGIDGEGIPTSKPRLQIDGVEIAGTTHDYTYQDVSVDSSGRNTLYEGAGSREGPAPKVFSKYTVYFPHHGLFVDDAHPIHLYDNNYRLLHSLTDHRYTMPSGKKYTQLYPQEGYWTIPESLITSKGNDILYLGTFEIWRGMQALIATGNEGRDYNLKFSIYAHTLNKYRSDKDGGAYVTKGMITLGSQMGGSSIITTQNLRQWGVPNPDLGGIGLDEKAGTFSYPKMHSFYVWFNAALPYTAGTSSKSQTNTWIKKAFYSAAGPTEYYWMAIESTSLPSIVAHISRMGYVTANWSENKNFNKVLLYQTNPHSWTDLTTAAAGDAGSPFAFLNKVDIGAAFHNNGMASYTASFAGYSQKYNLLGSFFVRKTGAAPGVSVDRYYISDRFFNSEYEKYDPGHAGTEMPHDVKGWFSYSVVNSRSVKDFTPLTDGNPFTQYQLIRIAPFASGSVVLQVDLGGIKDVDIIDLTQGFFNPTDDSNISKGTARFDVTNWFSLQYSTDSGVTYNYLHKDAYRFKLEGGEKVEFDREKLGENFQATHLRLIIEDQKKVDYMDGRYVIPIASINVWKDDILMGEAYLASDNANPVSEDQESRDNRKAAIKDDGDIITKYGERVYKDNEIKSYLNTNALVRNRAANLLIEFAKNNTLAKVSLAYAPHLEMGQTVTIIDSKNNINRNYFVESISDRDGAVDLQVAFYQ